MTYWLEIEIWATMSDWPMFEMDAKKLVDEERNGGKVFSNGRAKSETVTKREGFCKPWHFSSIVLSNTQCSRVEV